jgi:hypothetical protein
LGVASTAPCLDDGAPAANFYIIWLAVVHASIIQGKERRMRYVYPTNTTATDTGITFQQYVYSPLKVVPDLRGLLWVRELQLYLDMRRPEEDPKCERCRQREEDEYWDAVICDGCGGMRTVASSCPRCDSPTYHPVSLTDSPKGPPTGFGPYRERSK